MRAFRLVSAGVLLGGAFAYVFMEGAGQVDDGISRTYRCDQLAREADARKSTVELFKQFLRHKTLVDLEVAVSETELQLSSFDKGDHTVVVVGHSPQTAALEFQVSETGEIDVRPIPGSAPCAQE